MPRAARNLLGLGLVADLAPPARSVCRLHISRSRTLGDLLENRRALWTVIRSGLLCPPAEVCGSVWLALDARRQNIRCFFPSSPHACSATTSSPSSVPLNPCTLRDPTGSVGGNRYSSVERYSVVVHCCTGAPCTAPHVLFFPGPVPSAVPFRGIAV